MKVYYLQDPITKEIRYVGVTTQTLNTRLSGHVYDAKNKKGRHVLHWIATILEQGLRPEIHLIEECDDSVWQVREMYWIEEYRNRGYNLTNIDKGGNGVVTKEKRELSSIERSANAHKKPIYQLDNNLCILNEFNSTKEAAQYMNGKHSNIANSICYGRSAYGYFWCRVADYNNYKINVAYTNQVGVGHIKI